MRDLEQQIVTKVQTPWITERVKMPQTSNTKAMHPRKVIDRLRRMVGNVQIAISQEASIAQRPKNVSSQNPSRLQSAACHLEKAMKCVVIEVVEDLRQPDEVKPPVTQLLVSERTRIDELGFLAPQSEAREFIAPGLQRSRLVVDTAVR